MAINRRSWGRKRGLEKKRGKSRREGRKRERERKDITLSFCAENDPK